MGVRIPPGLPLNYGDVMQVWVILEEDRGVGVMVCGVYTSEKAAEASCTGNQWVEGPFSVLI